MGMWENSLLIYVLRTMGKESIVQNNGKRIHYSEQWEKNNRKGTYCPRQWALRTMICIDMGNNGY
jgi:hypothetical protein